MKSVIEVFEKAPVIIAGICYITGLLVVSIYLNQFGVSSPISPFRVSYLLAGLWALIPIIIAAAIYIGIRVVLLVL